ncbi:hypothetical protein GGR92_000648 [Spirosoma lacussanchae]
MIRRVTAHEKEGYGLVDNLFLNLYNLYISVGI